MEKYSPRTGGGQPSIIRLTQGKTATVDPEMHDLLSQWSWHYTNGYARCWNPFTKGPGMILMHRLVSGLTFESPSVICDHINGDTLDNRRANLRACTNQQNQANRSKRLPTSSVYRGVGYAFKINAKNPWRAVIRVDKRLLHIGYYPTEFDAAEAYNAAAVEHFGDYAKLNDVRRLLL